MGKKDLTIAVLRRDLADAEEYLRLAGEDLAYGRNYTDELRVANADLAAEVEVLKQTIVDQAVSLFGIVRDAGHQSVEAGLSPVYGGAETPR